MDLIGTFLGLFTQKNYIFLTFLVFYHTKPNQTKPCQTKPFFYYFESMFLDLFFILDLFWTYSWCFWAFLIKFFWTFYFKKWLFWIFFIFGPILHLFLTFLGLFTQKKLHFFDIFGILPYQTIPNHTKPNHVFGPFFKCWTYFGPLLDIFGPF